MINLSTDKTAVSPRDPPRFRPGGSIGISDIVADDSLTQNKLAERGNWVGCIAGALSYREYHGLLEGAGFEAVSLTATRQATDGMDSVIIKARKPVSVDPTDAPTIHSDAQWSASG